MATPSEKSPEIDEFLDVLAGVLFGRTRKTSIESNTCISCGHPATEFDDEISRKEYAITGHCQTCQNDIFGK